MEVSAVWFITLAALSVLSFKLGQRLGSGSPLRARLGLAVAFMLLTAWGWLQHNPAAAVHVVPVWILSHIEGTAAVPVFMLIAGEAWAISIRPRQRLVAGCAIATGVAFFLNGGFWMLETTPSRAFGHTVKDGVMMQSQDYSCVPAACVTALADVGVTASEEEMAVLTRTRPGAGATIMRALDGLRAKLAMSALQRPLDVELVQVPYDELVGLEGPMLVALRIEPTQRHMVVVREVNDTRVVIADPLAGKSVMSRREFEAAFSGEVLVFRR